MCNDLKPFTNNAKPTGRVLEKGSYGEVEEMRVGRKVVAGKKFRLSVNDDGTTRKFTAELLTLAQLHHPNVVAFEGVCRLPNEALPVLLMELLVTNLHSCKFPLPGHRISLERSAKAGITCFLQYIWHIGIKFSSARIRTHTSGYACLGTLIHESVQVKH